MYNQKVLKQITKWTHFQEEIRSGDGLIEAEEWVRNFKAQLDRDEERVTEIRWKGSTLAVFASPFDYDPECPCSCCQRFIPRGD